MTSVLARGAPVGLFTWDAGDRMTGWTTDNASSASTLDDAGRLLGETVTVEGVAMTRRYSHYANGQVQTFTGPDGATITYSYDGAGELSRTDIPGEGSLSVTERTWNEPRKIVLPGGTVQEIERNALLSPARLRVKDPSQVVRFDQQSTYGRLEELASRTTQGRRIDYAYDDALRLRKAEPSGWGGTTETFELDAAGNRLSDNVVRDTWRYDDANRLLQRGPVSYQYDADGNLIEKVDSSIAEPLRTTSYAYDAYNRLVEVRDGADQVVSRYTYDPFGYRLSKEVTAAGAANSGAAPGKRLFLQAEEGVLAEIDSDGRVLQGYGWQRDQPYGTAPLFLHKGDAYFYYHNDPLGLPRQLTDKSGSVVWEATKVGAFGEVLFAGGSTIEQPWRLPGQYADLETHLHYNVSRYYDPSTGRYLTADSAGLDGGLNFYLYADASPMNMVDPYGLWASLPDWFVNGAAGFGDSVFTIPFTSYSLTREFRRASGIGGVDACSTAYRNGGYGGDAAMLLGGSGLVRKALVRRPGTVWSHFIPDRATTRYMRGKPNPDYFWWLDNSWGRKVIDSKFNGNYVTPEEHWLTDYWATLKGRHRDEKPWSRTRELINRLPQWIPGLWMLEAAATDVANGDVGCGCT